MLYCFEVELRALIGKLETWETECWFGDLSSQGHLRVIQEPILRIKAYMIETLNKSNVDTNVKLRLELTAKLQKESLLFNETPLRFFKYSLLVLSLWLKSWLDVVLL